MYFEDFSSVEDVITSFCISEETLEGCKILFAFYGYECYDGEAFVLFEREGKLYEVNAGHCSCYGLEHQWEPEETSIEFLKKMFETKNTYTWKLSLANVETRKALADIVNGLQA